MSGICSCSVLSSGTEGLCDSCSAPTSHRVTLVLLNYLGKSDPEQLFLPGSSWELPHMAQNGAQGLLSTSSQPAFWPVSLPGLAPWHQWDHRSTFVIVHGSSISLSWQECLFFYLEKPAKSISYLCDLKDSL